MKLSPREGDEGRGKVASSWAKQVLSMGLPQAQWCYTLIHWSLDLCLGVSVYIQAT